MNLTKDADKMCCLIYKKYLEQRKAGNSKSIAKYFDFSFYIQIDPLSNWLEDDIDETLSELKQQGFIKRFVDGGFQLQDNFVLYMENRFKNGVVEVTDFLAKFIP